MKRSYIGPKTYSEALERLKAKPRPKFSPKPKPRAAIQRTARLGAGKRTKAWTNERRKLKADSERNGRTTCELRGVVPHECSYDNFLGYAHDAKRRKLSREDLKRAILVCNPVHDLLEQMKPEEMKRIVNDTIAARKEAA